MSAVVPRLLLAALLGAAVVACNGGASPSPTTDPAPADSPAATPSPAGSPDQPPATADPVPSEDLGEFSCDFPIVEPAGAETVTNILDVRIGRHDGYDRVVFEFSDGTPELTLDRATPPFHEDGSGFEVAVEGDAFLQLVMRGGTKQTETGESSYPGPTELDAGFPALIQLVEIGDFEAQSTWVLGLSEEACARVLLLEGPDRLVIDIEHGG